MPIIKILTGRQYELLQADLAHHKSRTEIIDGLLKDKGMTIGDLVQGKGHISWNPRKAPRVDVKAMMEKSPVRMGELYIDPECELAKDGAA